MREIYRHGWLSMDRVIEYADGAKLVHTQQYGNDRILAMHMDDLTC